MAEVVVSKGADADLERLVIFLSEAEPAAALATYDPHAAAPAIWHSTNTIREPTGSWSLRCAISARQATWSAARRNVPELGLHPPPRQ